MGYLLNQLPLIRFGLIVKDEINEEGFASICSCNNLKVLKIKANNDVIGEKGKLPWNNILENYLEIFHEFSYNK